MDRSTRLAISVWVGGLIIFPVLAIGVLIGKVIYDNLPTDTDDDKSPPTT